jgi:hypothetical protein
LGSGLVRVRVRVRHKIRVHVFLSYFVFMFLVLVCACMFLFLFVCGHLTTSNPNSLSIENRKVGCFRYQVCFHVCVPSRVIGYLCGVCACSCDFSLS